MAKAATPTKPLTKTELLANIAAATELPKTQVAAVLEALGADGSALQVIIGDGRTITVRGEVGSLDQIRRASEVIEGVRGGAEVVNLIRLRVPSTGGVVPG